MTHSKHIFAFSAIALLISCAGDFETIGNEQRAGVTGNCNGKDYNTTLYNCVLGEIVGSCKGESYYPEYQTCENGKIIDGAELVSSSSVGQSSSATQSSSSGVGGGGSSSSVGQSSSSAGIPQSSSSARQSSSATQSTTPPCSETGYGTEITLVCAEQTYSTIFVWGITWMAENFNYNANGSMCYNNEDSNCDTYGRLYNWTTAITVCPSGWHLPSDEEWDQLINFAGGVSSTAGNKLKATSGWNNGGNGTNETGFSALPGGSAHSSQAYQSSGIGSSGCWWSATEDTYALNFSWYRSMSDANGEVNKSYQDKTKFCSVRCVK